MHARTSQEGRGTFFDPFMRRTHKKSTEDGDRFPLPRGRSAKLPSAFAGCGSRLAGLRRGWARYVWPWARVAFGADKRSVALFRMALALTVLGDILDRAQDLRAHYTDVGVLPRHVALESFGSISWLSVHMLGGSMWSQVVIFIIHMMAALAMLVGWRSRTAALVVWFMTTSMHARNVLVLHAGDVLLRCSLLWALFLPLGDVYSFDAAFQGPTPSSSSPSPTASSTLRDRRAGDEERAEDGRDFVGMGEESDKKEAYDHHHIKRDASVNTSSADASRYACINAGTLAVVTQVSLMYFTSVFHKTGPEWTQTGTATYFALQLEYFRLPMAELMLQALHPHLLPFFTIAVFYWEWLGSLCFVFPYKTGFMRTIGTVAFMFMHLGFGSCLRLGSFSWTAEAALMVLLPGWFWDEVFFKYILRMTPERTDVELYYRSESPFNFYERFAKVMGTFFLFPEVKVLPLQELRMDDSDDEEKSTLRHKRSFAEISDASLATIDHEGKMHQDFHAIVSLCLASPVLWPMGRLLKRMAASRFLSTLLLRFGFVINVFVESCLHFFYGEQARSMLKEEHDEDDSPRRETFWKTIRPSKRIPSRRRKRRYLLTARNLGRLLRNALGLYLVYFVFGWTMNDIGVPHFVPRFDQRWIGFTLHIDQVWNMFSPSPPTVSWWYIIEATKVNQEVVELHRDRGLFEWKSNPLDDWGPPEPFADSFGNHRWFKFYESVNNHAKSAIIRLHFGRYICRQWNKRYLGPNKLNEFKIWLLSRRVALDGSRTELPKQLLWHHYCFENKPDLRPLPDISPQAAPSA